MFFLLFFAFLAGVVTILTPCIWPLLPIILSGSIMSRGHQRPLGITLGILVSFSIVTLAISSLVKLFHFDPNILRLLAVFVLVVLGISMIIPALAAKTELLISRLAGKIGKPMQQTKTGFTGGFITGLSLGIVWSPCAGPILATIAALAATGQVSLSVILVTLAYVIGVGIPLFLFAYGGQQLVTRTRFISKYTEKIQQVFGVIMLLTALAIYTNYDVYLQSQLLNAFPQLNNAVNSFESNSAVQQQLNALKGNQTTNPIANSDLLNTNYPAPDFVGITHWLNTDKPLTIKDLKGKVVLVDFWTYTCINCIRTLPHVTAWYEKYKSQRFVVIGVHTPEFQFEHDTTNVSNALKQFNIHYPVGQDNNYATWNNYNNQYWPAEYLIDANGNVRRTHFGEGEYDQTEMAIQTLLKEAGRQVTSSLINMPDQTPQEQISPETYLGASRMQFYYPGGSLTSGTQNFTLAENPTLNSFSLGGSWTITDEDAITGQGATLVYHFSANKVFLVLKPGTNQQASVKVYLDNKVISKDQTGSDVVNGVVTVNSDRLYNLVDLKGHTGEHVLRLEFQNPGTDVFAFTFG